MITKVDNHSQIVDSQFNKKIDRSIDFGKILENTQAKQNDLKVSSHAQDRLRERNINLSDTDMTNLKSAVEKIRNKGGREALIIYKNIAFVTSIKNNTIITAVDSASLKENVFTNIDSALIC